MSAGTDARRGHAPRRGARRLLDRDRRRWVSTGSTNADLMARAVAAPGPAEGQVLVARSRPPAAGRLGRSPGRACRRVADFSVLLRPAPGRRGAAAGCAPVAGVAVVSRCGRGRRGRGAQVAETTSWSASASWRAYLAEQSPDRFRRGDRHAAERRDPGRGAAGLPRPASPATSLLAEGAAGVPRDAADRDSSASSNAGTGVPARPRPGAVRRARRLPLAVRHPGTAGPRRAAGRPRREPAWQRHRLRWPSLIAGDSGDSLMPVSAGDVIHVRPET